VSAGPYPAGEVMRREFRLLISCSFTGPLGPVVFFFFPFFGLDDSSSPFRSAPARPCRRDNL